MTLLRRRNDYDTITLLEWLLLFALTTPSPATALTLLNHR